MHNKTLWYVADPMCSWCWGFAPVIEKIRQQYADRLSVELVLGGLRPGTKEPVASTLRESILHHWHNVQRMTGQPFKFIGALPDGFVYDTEIACRAVVTVSMIAPDKAFPFFMKIQHGFYTELLDVTMPSVLVNLAVALEINSQDFIQMFDSDAAKKKTLAHFQRVHQWGVQGFPTLIAQNTSGYSLLVGGYCSLDKLCLRLDTWLRK